MSTGLIIGLVAVLFVLVLGYNVVIQYKIQEEQKRKQEIMRLSAVVNTTEELVGFAQNLPFSNHLYICLYTRMRDSLLNIQSIDPKNKEVSVRIDGIKGQIEHLQRAETETNDVRFRVPKSDKQAIILLKIVKRLKDTIRTEHNKGRFATQYYIAENKRLEQIQLRINVENAIKRSNDALAGGQHGTALQLIKRCMDLLNTKNDDYSTQAREKLQVILDRLENKRQTKNEEEIARMREKERDEMEEIFGEKKKW